MKTLIAFITENNSITSNISNNCKKFSEYIKSSSKDVEKFYFEYLSDFNKQSATTTISNMLNILSSIFIDISKDKENGWSDIHNAEEYINTVKEEISTELEIKKMSNEISDFILENEFETFVEYFCSRAKIGKIF